MLDPSNAAAAQQNIQSVRVPAATWQPPLPPPLTPGCDGGAEPSAPPGAPAGLMGQLTGSTTGGPEKPPRPTRSKNGGTHDFAPVGMVAGHPPAGQLWGGSGTQAVTSAVSGSQVHATGQSASVAQAAGNGGAMQVAVV